MIHQYWIAMLTLVGVAACSDVGSPDQFTTSDNEKTKVVINASQQNTRTSLDDDGMTTRWSIGDQIAVWAGGEGGFSFEATPFTLYSYNSSYSSADFSATISPMNEGSYTYYAAYPTPTRIDGATTAVYNLPSTQDGTYNGAYDIMVAKPVTGSALSGLPQMALNFAHLCHAVRIEIPAGRNLFKQPVKRLEITFPTAVVGELHVDVTSETPASRLENGTNTLILNFPGEGLTDATGAFAWVFIHPATIDGEITFRAYNAQGYQSQTISTHLSNRVMVAGHTTPIDLTIREARPLTYLDFNVASNNLGEELTDIHLSHTEALFAVPFSTEDTANNSTPRSSDGHFRVAIYTDTHDVTSLQNQQLNIGYESENTRLNGNVVTLPSSIQSSGYTPISIAIPYLFDEDFSGISSFSRDDDNTIKVTSTGENTAVNLSQIPTSGWTGARCGASEGKAIRICNRGQQAVWVAGSYNGRIDSPPMEWLKEGKTVRLKITFNYSLNRVSSKGSANQHYLAFGMHHDAGPRNPTRNAIGVLGSDIASNSPIAANLYGPNDGSFDNIYNTVGYTVDNCTKSSRFVWEAYINTKCPDGYYNNWVFIDDIRIQIAK